jgi:hypothetical protein
MRNVTLSHGLHLALTEYLMALASGGDISNVLNTVIEQTADEPPSSISSADSQIAEVAGLSLRSSKQSIFQHIFRREITDSQLLLMTPRLEYLYIFHRNGYIREKALVRIHGPLPNSFIVAAIAWRMNDWAPRVRDSAIECAKRCFDKTDPVFLARFLLLTLDQQASWGRWSESERELITQQLRRSDVTSELAKLMLTERIGPLPSALGHIIRYPEIDCHLEALAKNAINPGIRAIALRALIELQASFVNGTQWRWIDKSMGLKRKEPLIEHRQLTVIVQRDYLYQLGLGDKSAIVRRVALSGIIKFDRYESKYQRLASKYLSDSSASVRSRAAFILDKSPAK